MSDDAVSVQAISIEPNNCALEEKLGLGIKFTLAQPLPSATWQIRFIADSAHKRKIVELGATASEDYAAGANSMRFEARSARRGNMSRLASRPTRRRRHRRWAS